MRSNINNPYIRNQPGVAATKVSFLKFIHHHKKLILYRENFSHHKRILMQLIKAFQTKQMSVHLVVAEEGEILLKIPQLEEAGAVKAIRMHMYQTLHQ